MPRNISGVYTLPAGNPVSPATIIESAWANTTLADIAGSITDSLDRSGRGSMLAAFKAMDGLVAQPGISFGTEPASGLYRAGAADIRFAVAGTDVMRWTPTGVNVTGTLAISGGLSFAGAITATAGNNTSVLALSGNAAQWGGIGVGRTALEGYFAVSGGASQVSIGDVAGDLSIRSNTGALFISAAGGATRLKMTQAGEFGIGANPVASVPLLVHTGANRNVAFLDQGSVATVSGMTDAGSSASLRVVGNTLQFSGSGSGVQATMDTSGRLVIGTSVATYQLQSVATGANLLGLFRDLDVTVSGAAGTLFDMGARNGATFTPGASILGVLENPPTGGFLALYTRTAGALTEKARVDNAGRVGVARVPTTHIFEVAGSGAFGYTADQAVRLIHNDAYIAFWNTTDSTRSGYIQMTSTGTSVWTTEVGGAGAISAIRINGTNRFAVDGNGRVYGTGIHNNAASMTGTTNQYIGSGSLGSATVVASANMTSVSVSRNMFIRTGNVVTWSGIFTGSVTAGGTPTSITIALPIASGFSVPSDLSGASSLQPSSGPPVGAMPSANTSSDAMTITMGSSLPTGVVTGTFCVNYEVL